MLSFEAALVQVRSQQDSPQWQEWKKGPPTGQGWQVQHPLVPHVHRAAIVTEHDLSARTPFKN